VAVFIEVFIVITIANLVSEKQFLGLLRLLAQVKKLVGCLFLVYQKRPLVKRNSYADLSTSSALGLPVVASNAGENAELVIHELGGILGPIGNSNFFLTA